SGMYYLDLMLRYWFVLLLFAGLAGAASYFFQSRQPELYLARVSVYIGNLYDPDPQVSSLESAERLALTYAELVKSYRRLNDAIQEVDPTVNVEVLRDNVSVEVIPDTSIMNITVKDTDPERTAALANALANVLIDDNRQTLTLEQQSQLTRIEENIKNLEELIEFTNTQHDIATAADDFILA